MSTSQRLAQPNPRWVRGTVGGEVIIDTRDSLNVWEVPYYPKWYIPVGDIDAELVDTEVADRSERLGDGIGCDMILPDGTKRRDAGVRRPGSEIGEVRDLVGVNWAAMDSWFEEDQEVFVHPRSPFVRVDAIPSSRRVRVSVYGHVVADSTHPVILFETGLPPRYYLPKVDVRMDLLTPTDTTSACPYKGWASYWSVTVGGTTHEDVAWGYRVTQPEVPAVAGRVCFYDERVDVEIDGVPQDRPATKFA